MGRRRRKEPETAMISGVTHDGRGIADVPGKKVFVAGALDGEEVEFIRRKSRRNYDEAELLDVIKPSVNRIEARCEAFGRCGGCVMQHISEEEQRGIKFQTLRDNLERIGKVEPEHWLEPIVAPAWHYRRRARLAVKDVPAKGRVLVGFRERHAPFITDMHRCEVLAKPVDALIDPLSELIASLSIRARIPQIEVAVAQNATALVFRVLDPPSSDDKARLQQFGDSQDLRLYLQTGGLDSVEPLNADESLESLYYTLPESEIRIDFDPVGFVQVNDAINVQMVASAIDYLELESDDRVLDLYCGIGNFSLPIARHCGEVLGVEGDAMLVSAAERNAELNALQNTSFRTADLSKIDGSEGWMSEDWDRLLLDPARSGAAEVVEHMQIIDPRRIVYVSCHPGTLARDAGTLVNEKGYTLESAGIIDMFPHTAHVESIAIFSRK
ncbi:MAG: 23S rRNA (uracil(1939)-C(5))-methyltransferase RlmD [Woeseiaceae bacterium]